MVDPTNVVGQRIGAFIIDLIISYILGIMLVVVFGGSDDGVAGLAVLLLWIGYAVMEGTLGGTPGKLALSLRVVTEDGQICGVGRAIGRMLMRIVDGIPFFFPMLLGLIVASSSSRHQRLGDMAAGTFVIKKEHLGQHVQAAQYVGISNAPPPPVWGSPAAGQPAPYQAPAQTPAQTPASHQPLVEAQWDDQIGRYVYVDESGYKQAWDDALGLWRPVD